MTPILVLCPFELLPLRGGGALRAFHLLQQLARYYEVHAVVFQPAAELRRETEGYKIPDEVRLYSVRDEPPPVTLLDRIPRGTALKYRWLRRSWRGPADGIFLQSYHLVERVVRENPIAAAILYELSAMTAAPIVQRIRPGALRLVDLYNVNHDLVAQELRRYGCLDPELDRNWRILHWTEHNLQRFVHSFFACSDTDRDVFQKNCGIPGFTVGNGVDSSFYSFGVHDKNSPVEKLVFTGWMGTKANQDALTWFRDELWPALRRARPSLELLLVGGGAPPTLARELAALPGVTVTGEVTDVRPFVRQCRVAAVPLRIGSGTRLKILEAMAQGTPVVSTSKGADGLGATHGTHLLLADDTPSFVRAVLCLLDDDELVGQMRIQARHFVEQTYDWNVIGDTAHRALQQLMKGSH